MVLCRVGGDQDPFSRPCVLRFVLHSRQFKSVMRWKRGLKKELEFERVMCVCTSAGSVCACSVRVCVCECVYV